MTISELGTNSSCFPVDTPTTEGIEVLNFMVLFMLAANLSSLMWRPAAKPFKGAHDITDMYEINFNHVA